MILKKKERNKNAEYNLDARGRKSIEYSISFFGFIQQKILLAKTFGCCRFLYNQMHLEKAYQNFFRDPKIGFPKFKSKHRTRKSYTTNVVKGNIRLEECRIRLPKLKWLHIKKHREIPGEYRLKLVTVSMELSGKYFAFYM